MTVPMLVTTEWLAEHLNDPGVCIADVRWYLFDKDKNGRQEYLNGHIPGAVFIDVDAHLSSPRGQGPGRHPLPRPEVFAQAASAAGITPATHVIAYDDRGGASAARLWWLLRYFGHEQASLLDGGITLWIAQGHPLQKEIPVVSPSTFIPQPRPAMVVDGETVDRLRNDPRALVLDVRAPERYEGRVEPIDPIAGHIPGAKSAPYTENLREDQRFRDPAELRKRFEKLGAGKAEKIVSYCGSGINASQNVFTLELAGFEHPLLYEGSWSDWSRTPGRPVATGKS